MHIVPKTSYLSVIICTYNRAELFTRSLESLCEQELSSELYEVVVVDNNSTDRTPHIANSFSKKYPNVRYVTEMEQGLSFARNKGCREALGEYIIYNDDDSMAPPQYLSNILEVIRGYSPDIIGGPIYPYYTHRKPLWFRDKYEIRQYEQVSGYSLKCRVSGGNFIIKKNLLIDLGLFDVQWGMKANVLGLNAEAKVLDTYRSIIHRSKQKVYYSLECYNKHHVPKYKMKLAYMMRRSYLSGRMFMRLRALEKRVHLARIARILVYSTVDYLIREVKEAGLREADYIDFLRRSFRSIGIVNELIIQLTKGGINLAVFQTSRHDA